MVLSSERISLPRMKAVPEVGGNKPVKMDLKNKQNRYAGSTTNKWLLYMLGWINEERVKALGKSCIRDVV